MRARTRTRRGWDGRCSRGDLASAAVGAAEHTHFGARLAKPHRDAQAEAALGAADDADRVVEAALESAHALALRLRGEHGEVWMEVDLTVASNIRRHGEELWRVFEKPGERATLPIGKRRDARAGRAVCSRRRRQ